jgi:hypothetical protein
MSSSIVTCDSCHTENRVSSNLIGKRIRCGACRIEFKTSFNIGSKCKLCTFITKNEISLSDGGSVHHSCLKSLNDEIYSLVDSFNKKRLNRLSIEQKIKSRSNIIFHVKTLFKSPEVETEDLVLMSSRLSKELEEASSFIKKRKEIISSIYDYFLTYPPDWDARRAEVFIIDGRFCSVCRSKSQLQVHHITPLSKGGSNHLSNLQVLCESCHSVKHGGINFSDKNYSSENAFSKRVIVIKYAIENSKKIEFEYRKPSDKKYQKRTILPEKLLNKDHVHTSETTLCVSGYCELRRANRIFALKRMKGLKSF